jgi:hypothetical protein
VFHNLSFQSKLRLWSPNKCKYCRLRRDRLLQKVTILTRKRDGGRKNCRLIPRRDKRFSLRHGLYADSLHSPSPYRIVTGGYLPGGKAARPQANLSPPASAVDKGTWRFISTQLHGLWRGAQLGRMTNFIAPFHARSNLLLIATLNHPKLNRLWTNIGLYIKYTYYILVYVLPFHSCTLWRGDSCFQLDPCFGKVVKTSNQRLRAWAIFGKLRITVFWTLAIVRYSK